MQLVILFGAGFFAAAVTFATNWLALIPWRRARDQHWTERARLHFPVRMAAASSLWTLPAALTAFCVLMWPDESPHWALLILATAIGAVAGNIPMDREVFPRISLRYLLRQVAITCLIRFLMWFVFLTAAAMMPDEFNLETLLLAGAVLFACVLWNRNGWVFLGRKLGLFQAPPERLQKIVRETSAVMNIGYGELWLMRV